MCPLMHNIFSEIHVRAYHHKKTRDDLADLASDELCSKEDGLLREYQLSEDDANRIIMAARAHWFDDEAPEGEKKESDPSEAVP